MAATRVVTAGSNCFLTASPSSTRNLIGNKTFLEVFELVFGGAVTEAEATVAFAFFDLLAPAVLDPFDDDVDADTAVAAAPTDAAAAAAFGAADPPIAAPVVTLTADDFTLANFLLFAISTTFCFGERRGK